MTRLEKAMLDRAKRIYRTVESGFADLHRKQLVELSRELVALAEASRLIDPFRKR